MDEARVEFRGDEGTPIRYEEIVLWRDVVFLVWDRPYDEEVQSMGAPPIGTFNYTGYLNRREGISFGMTYFSLVVADGHLPINNGTRVLADWEIGGYAQCSGARTQAHRGRSRGSEAGGRVGYHHPAQDGTWNARAKAIRSRACLVPRMQEVEHRFRKSGPAPSPASIAHIRRPVPKAS